MKVAIYGKTNCKICSDAKNKMRHFSLEKVNSLEEWVDGTWIERNAEDVVSGVTDSDWRGFPDAEVLTFINVEETDKVPLIWVNGEIHYYAEAMKMLKALKKSAANKKIELIHVDSDEVEHKMVAIA